MLVLSLFSGVGLLDKAFQDEGFCMVSAGDLILNQDVRDFTGIKGKFDGVIGGVPCQSYSKANRKEVDFFNCYSTDMMREFKRIVLECDSPWALIENVERTPKLEIEGYNYQRIDINQSWYTDVNRLRHIQFYYKDDISPLHIERVRNGLTDIKRSPALASDDRTFEELKELQGLSKDYDLPSFTVSGKKQAVGNGVPLVVGSVLAKAVRESVTDRADKLCDSAALKYCRCDCRRIVKSSKALYYDDSCRKRYQRAKGDRCIIK